MTFYRTECGVFVSKETKIRKITHFLSFFFASALLSPVARVARPTNSSAHRNHPMTEKEKNIMRRNRDARSARNL